MKPNVILINCDDLGYGDLGCYGSPVNDTPYIDFLAENGVKFNSFYASSSVCTPSRASLMTGCYAQRVELPLVLFPAAEEGLNKDEFTLGNLFQNSGYKTMLVGKWHCGDHPDTLPLKFGFDDYYGLPYSNDMGIQLNPQRLLPPLPLIHGDEIIQQQPDQTGITERYVEKSIDFIRNSVKSDNNFFLYLAHMHVHLPLYEQKQFIEKSRNGDFGACVSSIDWSVGVLLHELEKLSVLEDTLIIFTSDNGSTGKFGASNAPLKGTKFSNYEGGFRVPFISYWKGHIKEGVEIDNIASNIDLLPTFANLIDGKLSDNIIDGVDISEMLCGNDVEKRKEFIYFCNYNLTAIRKGKYKLQISHSHMGKRPKNLPLVYDPMFLFDLENDITEDNNIINLHPEIAEDLFKSTDKTRKALGDTLTNTVGDEVRPCRKIENPQPLTIYDENHPYIISMYDKDERG
ncbi:MAG: sulfatase [Clostridia bacterium]